MELTKKRIEKLMGMLYIRKGSRSIADYEYAKANLKEWNDKIAKLVSDYVGI